jgi:hypothetical protein
LADPNHEDGCVGDPEPRRQHREAVVHWAEDVVQRPRDNNVECDRQEQAQDTEPEQAIGRHDVCGGLCCIPLCHQASQRNKVAKACQCRDEQQSDSGGEAGGPDRPVRRQPRAARGRPITLVVL